GSPGLSTNGKLFAVADRSNHRGVIVNLERPADSPVRLPCPNINSIAVHPTGHWVATGTWKGDGLKVWDLRTRELVHRFNSDAAVAMSPDGKWLAGGTGKGYHLWEVGSWRPGSVFPRKGLGDLVGGLAFSPDGRVLAINPSPGLVRLIDVATDRELAT